jgi:ribonuclease HII
MTISDLSQLTVSQIHSQLNQISPLPEMVLTALEADPRAGVRALAHRARMRHKKQEQERARLERMLVFENNLRTRGFAHIAGVDEAGRGPLAGPVVAAAVILPPHTFIEGLNDSKTLSEQRREALFTEIQKIALSFSVAQASPEEIDHLNIRNATHLAMRRALETLSIKPDRVLIDGNALPESPFVELAIVGGDQKSLSIAAASVLAKVTRDRLMVAYDLEFPEYGFAKHKGYGSADHLLALKKHGPCVIHRKTFGGVLEGTSVRSEDFEIFAEGIQTAQSPDQLEAIGQSIASIKSVLPKTELDTLRQFYQKRRHVLDQSGPKGERMAAAYLRQNGYSLLEIRFRAAGAEIDIIANKSGILAFVEVKTASTPHFGCPETWVTPQKQKQIIRVAKAYLQKHPHPDTVLRFDVIAIQNQEGHERINHIKNAFVLPG